MSDNPVSAPTAIGRARAAIAGFLGFMSDYEVEMPENQWATLYIRGEDMPNARLRISLTLEDDPRVNNCDR